MAGNARPCSTSAVHIVSLVQREARLSLYARPVAMVSHRADAALKDYMQLLSGPANGGTIQKATRATAILGWNRECMKRRRRKLRASSGAEVTTYHPGTRRRGPTERGSATRDGAAARPSAVKYSLNRLKKHDRSNEWITLGMFSGIPKP